MGDWTGGGYLWDQRTLPEATVNPAPPDSDRHIMTLGASYWMDTFGIHANFSNAFFARRTALTSAMPGTWEGGWPGGTVGWIFGLTVSANLDVGAPFGAAMPATELVAAAR
jgi:long-subunit fatty acid transport protein